MPFFAGFILGLLACGVLPEAVAAGSFWGSLAGLLLGACCAALPQKRLCLVLTVLVLLGVWPYAAACLASFASGSLVYWFCQYILPEDRWRFSPTLASLIGFFLAAAYLFLV